MIATADVVAYDDDIGGRLNAYNALLTYVDAPGARRPRGSRPWAARCRIRCASGRGAATLSPTRLPAAGAVELAVYDLNGRRVAQL